jgi:hypothetical protein
MKKIKARKPRAFTPTQRRQMKTTLRKALKTEIQTLSTEMQQILCDDLVTALQNRLNVLVKVKPKRR